MYAACRCTGTGSPGITVLLLFSFLQSLCLICPLTLPDSEFLEEIRADLPQTCRDETRSSFHRNAVHYEDISSEYVKL